MSKNHKLALGIIVVAALGVTIFMFKAVRPEKKDASLTVTRQGVTVATLKQKASDPIRGNSRASVTIFEFSDFGCEHCASMAPVLEAVVEEDNDVKVVWKDVAAARFPTPSINAHVAARCAQRQGAFWEYHDGLFANQEFLNEATYFDLAAQLELNESKFEKCYRDQAVKPLVDEGTNLANALGIEGTPFFVIGNEQFSGARTKEFIQRAVAKTRN